tara:strand:+ start:501 stop:644 length:144 start_codon:yes stop_codon:yes gene_type:complete
LEIGKIIIKIITNTIMIVGPVGVSNKIDANTPEITERTPINEEKKAI